MVNRRWICIILCLWMVLFFVLSVSAQDNIENATTAGSASYEYYAQYLTAFEKRIYDGLKNTDGSFSPFGVSFDQPFLYTVDEKLDSVPDSLSREVEAVVSQSFKAALWALGADHPEIYDILIGGGGTTTSWSFALSVSQEGESVISTVSCDEFTVHPVKDPYFKESESYRQAFEQALADIPIEGNTRYEMVKSIFMYVLSHMTYDLDAPQGHNAYGALMNGAGVCEGYAKLFKLLCDREQIPCVVVCGDTGEEHMWNYVQMEDGIWYAVDTTWADSMAEGSEDAFFLIGSLTKADDEIFEKSHVLIPLSYYAGNDRLVYPELSRESYARPVVGQEGQKENEKPTQTPTGSAPIFSGIWNSEILGPIGIAGLVAVIVFMLFLRVLTGKKRRK